MLGYPYTYGDCLSSDDAIKNMTQTTIYSRAFTAGLIYGVVIIPNVTNAIDKQPATASQKAVKEVVKRTSNAFGCSAIAVVCGKAAAKNPSVAKAVALDPKVAAAFACGFAVSWCVKYAIFDN